jgi:hypothetical protein
VHAAIFFDTNFLQRDETPHEWIHHMYFTVISSARSQCDSRRRPEHRLEKRQASMTLLRNAQRPRKECVRFASAGIGLSGVFFLADVMLS